MAKKEFKYRGKSVDELQSMSDGDFLKLLPARQRRSLTRGHTELQKAFFKKLVKKNDNVKTHCRNMVIIPLMTSLLLRDMWVSYSW